MLASTGKANSETVIPLQQLQASYDIIPDNIPKVMDRRNTGDHGEMLYSGNGYVTAWLMWHLQGVWEPQAHLLVLPQNCSIMTCIKINKVISSEKVKQLPSYQRE